MNALRPRQICSHFADVIFKYIFLKKNIEISGKISLKFVPMVRTNNIPALVQIMVWCWPGDKSLSEAVMVSLLTHICVTWPQLNSFLVLRRKIPQVRGQWHVLMFRFLARYIKYYVKWCAHIFPYREFHRSGPRFNINIVFPGKGFSSLKIRFSFQRKFSWTVVEFGTWIHNYVPRNYK